MTDFDLVPPHSLDAERAVLGAIFINPDTLPAVMALLSEDATVIFYSQSHQRIYQAIIKLHRANTPADIVIVMEQLKSDGHLEEAGGPVYLAELTDAVTTSANVEHYATIVRDMAVRRRVISVSTQLTGQAYDLPADIDRLVGTIQTEATSLTRATTDGFELTPFSNWRDIAQVPVNWIFQDTLPTGIVACLAAPGGTGKSFLALTLALSAVTGVTLLPIFRPTRPLKVLALFGEDVIHQVARRLQAITDLHRDALPMPDDIDAALRENFRIRCTGAQALLSTESRTATPTPTPFFRALMAEVIGNTTVKTIGDVSQSNAVDLLIIDPISKFHGLPSENDNAQVSQLMNALQLLAGHDRTVLFCHHVRKGFSVDFEADAQASPRGASAFVDESRLVTLLHTFTDDDAERYGIPKDDVRKYLHLQVIKDNYSEFFAEPVYLRRYTGGALRQADLRNELIERVARIIRDWLVDKGDLALPKRDIRNAEKGKPKDLCNHIDAMTNSKATRGDREKAIDWGLENKVLRLVDGKGKSGQPQNLIGAGSGGPARAEPKTPEQEQIPDPEPLPELLPEEEDLF